MAAVAEHRPGFGSTALRHLEAGGARMGSAFLEALAAELGRVAPVTLVVDDLHELADGVVAELGWLVERAPSRLHLVVGTRAEPPVRLARLRAHGQLTEVRATALALREGEVAALVEHVVGHPLAPAQLRLLRDRTEGWAVGVQLAALALRQRADVDGYLRTFSGANRVVADYLTDEVVSHLPPDLRSFLWSTAVVGAVSAELADHLTGRHDGAEVLAELERRELFVAPLDGRPGWFRYHQLFADVLRHQLRAQDRVLHDDLLERAADWHLARDALRPAIEALLQAQRWQRALDLIAAHGWTFYEGGDAALAIRWLEAVPSGERRRHGRAELTLVVLHRLVGDATVAAALVDELERARGPGSPGAMAADVVRAMGVDWDVGPEEALAAAERALAWFAAGSGPEGGPGGGPPEPPDAWICGWARLSGAIALAHLGRRDEAVAWARGVLDEAGAHPALQVRALGALALVEARTGDLGAAHGHVRRALALAGEAGRGATATGPAHLAAAVVAYERGELDEAARALGEAEVAARVDKASARLAEVVAERARLSLARGRNRDGLDLLARWQREGEPAPPPAVRDRLAAVEAQLLAAAGEPDRARRALARADRTPDTLAAAAALAAASSDWGTLALVVRRWPPSTRRGRIQHALWAGVLAEAEGDEATAASALAHAVRLAGLDGHHRALVEGGPAWSPSCAGRPPWSGTTAGPTCGPSWPTPPPPPHGPAVALSPRELDVLVELATLLTNQEIAERLGVSPNTLKTHVRRIYRKLGVTSRRGALARAAELGLR